MKIYTFNRNTYDWHDNANMSIPFIVKDSYDVYNEYLKDSNNNKEIVKVIDICNDAYINEIWDGSFVSIIDYIINQDKSLKYTDLIYDYIIVSRLNIDENRGSKEDIAKDEKLLKELGFIDLNDILYRLENSRGFMYRYTEPALNIFHVLFGGDDDGEEI